MRASRMRSIPVAGDGGIGAPHAGLLVTLHTLGQDSAVVFGEHRGDAVGDGSGRAVRDPTLGAVAYPLTKRWTVSGFSARYAGVTAKLL